MDQALDDIIKSKKGSGAFKSGRGGGGGGSRRGGGGGGNGGRGGFRQGLKDRRPQRAAPIPFTKAGGIPSGKWEHDKFDGDSVGGGGRAVGSRLGRDGGGPSSGKILIENLDFGVNDEDLHELFDEIGGIRKLGVHYDKSGRSAGSADVIFERANDARRAKQKYDGVPLDGRPMEITIVGGSSRAGVGGPTRASENVARARDFAARNGGGRSQRFNNNDSRREGGGFGGSRRGGGGRGGGGRGRGGGGGGRGGRSRDPAPSVEDLDKELDAYLNKN